VLGGGCPFAHPIQALAIPALLTAKNAAIQAQTGSGKTLGALRACPVRCV